MCYKRTRNNFLRVRPDKLAKDMNVERNISMFQVRALITCHDALTGEWELSLFLYTSDAI